MYNELVKKISEASPFQPMAGEELNKARAGEVYIVQEENDGMPDDPEVFEDRAEAEAYYIQLANDRHEANYATFDEAVDMVGDKWGSWGVRLFDAVIRKRKGA